MLARYSPVRADHILFHAWKARERTEGNTYVPYPSGKYMPCYCEAKLSGPFVAGILSFEESAPKGQMSFEI